MAMHLLGFLFVLFFFVCFCLILFFFVVGAPPVYWLNYHYTALVAPFYPELYKRMDSSQ